MHPFEMPQSYVNRVVSRQGRSHTCETFDGSKTALVVIDMQNYFMVEPYPAACPEARSIVANNNRLAQAVRKAGGKVIWVRNIAPAESEASWSMLKERFQPNIAKTRWESLHIDHHGAQLWPELEVRSEDLHVSKRRYSAFTRGSSDMEVVLKDHGIDTLIVTGVCTNVCCESTARDAMMLNYRAVMVSDACATLSDEEHAGALGSFYLFFGDVQSTEEIVGRLAT
jgi:ureidoacrylate peracid hydrolase